MDLGRGSSQLRSRDSLIASCGWTHSSSVRSDVVLFLCCVGRRLVALPPVRLVALPPVISMGTKHGLSESAFKTARWHRSLRSNRMETLLSGSGKHGMMT